MLRTLVVLIWLACVLGILLTVFPVVGLYLWALYQDAIQIGGISL
jgi:hypothetical protein